MKDLLVKAYVYLGIAVLVAGLYFVATMDPLVVLACFVYILSVMQVRELKV